MAVALDELIKRQLMQIWLIMFAGAAVNQYLILNEVAAVSPRKLARARLCTAATSDLIKAGPSGRIN